MIRLGKLLLILVTFLTVRCSAANNDTTNASSSLDCPVDFNKPNHEDQYDTSRYSKGEFTRNIVRSSRKKPESYYQNIVDNVIMLICDVTIAKERCVEESSLFAAKEEGNCITAVDNTCPTGKCERASNCYWNSVEEGKNRTTRFDPQLYGKASKALIDTNDSYAREITQIGIIGIIIAFLLLCFWALFFIGRYLCCCLWAPLNRICFLCSPIPKRDGYSTCNLVIPILLYVVAVVGVTTSGAMAYVGNQDISVAISNTFLHADNLVEDLITFLDRSQVPLVNLDSLVDAAAVDASQIFNGTNFVRTDALNIVDSFVGYFSLHSQGLNASNAIETFDAASQGFDEKVTPITDQVQDMLDTMEYDLYENAGLIKGGLSSALSSLESFSEQSTNWQGTIYEYEGQELGVRDLRRNGVMVMFLVSFFFAILGLFGILFAKSSSSCLSILYHGIKIAGLFSAWLGTLSLVLASISLCLSFVLHDACQISDIVSIVASFHLLCLCCIYLVTQKLILVAPLTLTGN